ncbi:hypothetical protein LOF17_14805 [Sinorhizobium meliloti]|uniref:hypothetical protein n=1 Tax=Rhizobium meliloti TaxID=382 RepID=UPI0001E4EB9F|nr:hypothetical protein [Sinorhizobium meliloti]MDE4589014.1 hypothetical protein [Sinorhizobium meliloti]SEJ83236.1 hypothetical protein SAMN04244575_06469 [Sinorhizobium meliloti]
MPTSHDLKGLMKFLAREEWRECFGEVFYDHFGPVLDAGDMDFEDIAEILGDDWAMTLWGCAFEDFLTQDFEVEGGNIVDEYLKRRGWKENAQAKNYMKALRTSVMSLYEVSEIVPGKSLAARDLVRGGDPIAVSEGTATSTLKQWDRIAARIVPVMGTNVFAGGLLPFTPQATDALFDGPAADAKRMRRSCRSSRTRSFRPPPPCSRFHGCSIRLNAPQGCHRCRTRMVMSSYSMTSGFRSPPELPRRMLPHGLATFPACRRKTQNSGTGLSKSRSTTPVNAVHRLSTLRWKTGSGCGEMWN